MKVQSKKYERGKMQNNTWNSIENNDLNYYTAHANYPSFIVKKDIYATLGKSFPEYLGENLHCMYSIAQLPPECVFSKTAVQKQCWGREAFEKPLITRRLSHRNQASIF